MEKNIYRRKERFFPSLFCIVILLFIFHCIIDFNRYCSIMMMHNDLDHVSHTQYTGTRIVRTCRIIEPNCFLSDFSTSINFICRIGFNLVSVCATNSNQWYCVALVRHYIWMFVHLKRFTVKSSSSSCNAL